jgi:tetratricopeptide (TPR) repeat protein
VKEAVMLELKPLTREAVPRALEKAERYRLLNEPGEAESICLDVLAADPGNQRALVTLLLALTDQFDEGVAGAVGRAQEVLAQLSDEYERAYYAGIVWERRAKAKLHQGGPGSGYAAFDALEEAMRLFEQAERIRPAGNDDARLRWNACARILQRTPSLGPAPDDWPEPPLE